MRSTIRFFPVILFSWLIFAAGGLLYAEDQSAHDVTRVFSFDMAYMLTGLRHSGWGIGVKYEHRVVPNLSIAGGYSHTIVKVSNSKDIWCATVGLNVQASYYPLAQDMRRLFFSLGWGTEFLNYFGDDKPKDENVSVHEVIGTAGWRYIFSPTFGLDIFAGYIYLLPQTHAYGDVHDYVKNGVQVGAGCKKIL